jgi:hypothetical protein
VLEGDSLALVQKAVEEEMANHRALVQKVVAEKMANKWASAHKAFKEEMANNLALVQKTSKDEMANRVVMEGRFVHRPLYYNGSIWHATRVEVPFTATTTPIPTTSNICITGTGSK